MAIAENRPIGVASPVPGIAPGIEGAPAGVAGSGDGRQKPLSADADRPVPAGGVRLVPTVDVTGGGVSPEQRERDAAVAGTDRQIRTIQDWMDAQGNRPETEDERRKRERKEKSKRIIAAVSDGLSAMSNLYFTTQYAPNMYDPSKSQSGVVDARLERLKAEREQKRDQYMNFALKLGDLENQRAATLRELEAQQERQRFAREKADRDAQTFRFEQSLWPDKQREQTGKADKAEQDARVSQAAAAAAPDMQAAKLDTERARKASYDAAAASSRASASASRARAGSAVHHFRGKAYVSDKDYAKDVAEAARAYNRRHEGEDGFTPIVVEDWVQTGYGKKRAVRKPEDYAGEVERRLEEENLGKGYGNDDNKGY